MIPSFASACKFLSKTMAFVLVVASLVPAVTQAAIVQDTSFNANHEGKFGSTGTYYLTKQSDGKILVGGAFGTYNGVASSSRLVRLNADGTDDTAFNAAMGSGFNNNVQHIHQFSNGKVLVTGNFTTFNGNTRGRIVPLNADGTEDSSFLANAGSGFAGSGVFTAREQADGKIIIGGSLTSFNGFTISNLARINADGTVDTSFNVNLKTLNSFVRDIEIQPSGKIVVAGAFTTYDGNVRNRILRLNSDGTEDLAFASTTGTGFNSFVFRTSQDASGNLYFGGDFTTYNGSTTSYIVKTNSEGVIDPTFNANIGTGSNDDLLSVRVATSTGKILLGGNSSMTTFNGTTSARIARLNADGTVDGEFGAAMGSGFNGQMQYVQQFGNEIYAAGTFTSFNGATSTRFMKFLEVPNDTTPPVLTITTTAVAPVDVPFVVMMNSSENASGLDIGDIQVTNATLSNFLHPVASTTWSVMVTPTAAGTITLTVSPGAITDAAGNPSVATSTLSIASSFGQSASGGSTSQAAPSSARTGGSSAPNFSWESVFGQASAGQTGQGMTNGAYLPEVCSPYINTFIKLGAANNADDVRRLETFLNTYEGESLVVNGIYEQADFEAVKRFQQKNSGVLSFWNISAPTGYVYISTQKAINRKYCERTKKLECPYFGTHQKLGDISPEVSKIKLFLNRTQGESLGVGQSFDSALEAAVKRFQARFASKVLAPWGLSQPTGNWYQSTRKAAEDVLGCFAPVRLDNGKILE
ncbi:MAG TPA: Ig-like domain-containing protein [Candidatus Paceibacterota bacterium]